MAATSPESINHVLTGFIHPKLLGHVRHAVEAENWAAVASLTAIFVEDYARKKGGDPRSSTGQRLVGSNLYSRLLNPKDGVLSLGDKQEISERQGWMNIANGFAMALGNVNRHRIEERPDQRVYAFGVLGSGSLIVTQIDLQYPYGYRRFQEGEW